MEKNKRSTILWLLVGFAFLAAIAAGVFGGIKGETACLVDVSELTEPSMKMLEYLHSADITELGNILYNSPVLVASAGEQDSAELFLWNAYLESMQFRFPGTYRQSGESIELDVQIECLDLSAVVQQLHSMTIEITDTREAALQSAAIQLLAAEPPFMTRDVTLLLSRGESGWQVVLTEQLQQLLSGFVSE